MFAVGRDLTGLGAAAIFAARGPCPLALRRGSFLFGLLHHQPMSVAAMLDHNLVHMRDIMIGQFLMFALAAAVLLAFIFWTQARGSHKFRIRESFSKPGQLRREIFNSSRTLIVYTGIQIVARLMILTLGFILTFDNHLPLWQVAISFPLIMIGHDAYFYWTHRFFHLPGVYQLIHREHHKSRAPTVFTAYSFSIVESAVQGAYPILYVALFPCTFPTLIFFYTVAFLHDVTVHSGVDPFPRWLILGRFGWVCGSVHHDMHHEVGRSNYGLYTHFWDRLMGTEHPDFERVFDYVHSPGNDGHAYRRLLRGRTVSPQAKPVEFPADATNEAQVEVEAVS
jgi:sterol desaturase/sphingolipid hydroxylase (fatty acid hydroxylase superfamily)